MAAEAVDDGATSVVSMALRRRASGGVKAESRRTLATEWIANAQPGDAELQNLLASLPTGILQKVRLFNVGHGTRVRECILCGCHSNSADPVLGKKVMIIWGHLDKDGVSVLGMIDYYCLSAVGLVIHSTLKPRISIWKQPGMRLADAS